MPKVGSSDLEHCVGKLYHITNLPARVSLVKLLCELLARRTAVEWYSFFSHRLRQFLYAEKRLVSKGLKSELSLF